MATRDDITLDYSKDPRIARIAAPSVEVVVQDLHDTLSDIDDEIRNLIHTHTIESAGKESLGGGVQVAVTSTLQNAVVAFDARKTSAASGTITTGDSLGLSLIDSGASFLGVVEPGAWVVNLTDSSVCSVVTVVSDNELLTDGLGDGTLDQFTSADEYKVFNVIQCTVSGGNIVAVDQDDLSISPILPTMGTQVLITASSSATLLSADLLTAQILDLWLHAGLDITNPLVITATSRDAGGNLTMTITEAPAGTVTVQRL